MKSCSMRLPVSHMLQTGARVTIFISSACIFAVASFVQNLFQLFLYILKCIARVT